MYLIKLGGSVITDKSELYRFNEDATRRLIGEIRESGRNFVLVHGAGSFGHIIADRHKLQDGFHKDEQLEGFSRVHSDVRELNLKVLDIMRANGMRAISLAPNNILTCENKSINNFDASIFRTCTDLGVTPVTFGDVVFDTKLGFCICSGDDLMLELSRAYRPERAIFVADVDGIFDRDPRAHENAKLLTAIDRKAVDDLKRHQVECPTCGKGGKGDATGGMLRKIEIMLKISELGVDTILLNGLRASRLKDCMSSKAVTGTVAKTRRE